MSEIKYDQRNGGPFDRGGADSWYDRGRRPHYFKGQSYASEEVPESQMTPEEIEAYLAGYDDNEASGGKKDWS
jgi:hypothetical protein